MEKTFVMVKPDGVQRALTGEIIKRIEQKGFRLVGIKMLTMTEELAKKHYVEHIEKEFFPLVLEFMISGPVVAMVWAGPNVITSVRSMMGKTNPMEASPGTIRGDFAIDVSHNIIHGSDSPEAAQREINLFFKAEEINIY
ncbi:MAG TPA: nucleoside-diphosphate kinase [Syntrophomonadaceae bacterium]|nr:nucleoside-diphosphate kinase [Syntrophomonadaceae bacterium]